MSGHGVSLLLYDGYRFDFHKELRPEQPTHLNSSTCRRILEIDVLVAHFSEFLQMGKIQKVAV